MIAAITSCWICSWILFAIAMTPSCGVAEPGHSTQSEVPERYRFLKEGGFSEKDLPAVQGQLPYERIELSESNPWTWGGSPITLQRDETISVGGSPPKTGTISIFEYGELCYLIERIHFESMQPRYAWDGFDATTYTVKVWRVGSKDPITVEDYGSVGPSDLWTLRTAIHGVASQAHWAVPEGK